MKIETVTLKNGIRLQMLGVGTYKASVGSDMRTVIKNALDIGYRAIDSAAHYGNEEEVGDAIRHSGYRREELFLTSKIWNTDHGYKESMQAYKQILEKLGTNIDMLLIHWPCPMKKLYQETWKALNELYVMGKVKAIGVSNFKIHHLEELKKTGLEIPMVNQVEMHPFFIDYELITYCRENGIILEAWSPLLRKGDVLENGLMRELAGKYGKSPAQIVLRYLTQYGTRVIVKASNKEHAAQNAGIFDFTILDEDMERLKTLNTGKRVFQDPDDYYL